MATADEAPLDPPALLNKLEGLLVAKASQIALCGQLGEALLSQQAELESRIRELDEVHASLASPTAPGGSPSARRTRGGVAKEDGESDSEKPIGEETRKKLAALEEEMKSWDQKNQGLYQTVGLGAAEGPVPDLASLQAAVAENAASSPLAAEPDSPARTTFNGGIPPDSEPRAGRRPSAAAIEAMSLSKSVANFTTAPPATPSQAAAAARRARNNAQHRNNDIELATEIGTHLLTEVRRMQALLAERDEMLRETREEKDAVMRELDEQRNARKNVEDSIEKYKEENWNLEVMTQDLRKEVTEATSSVSRIEVERSRLTRDLAVSREAADAQKVEFEKVQQALEATKQKHETDMAGMRKAQAGLMRDKSDLQGTLEGLKAEVVAKTRGARPSLLAGEGGLAPDADGLSTPRTTNDEADPFRTGGGGTQARRKTGDAFVAPDVAGLFSNGDDDEGSPVQRGQGAGEVQSLRGSLAHAQKTIASLRASLAREKGSVASLKRKLGEVDGGLVESEEEDEDENESSFASSIDSPARPARAAPRAVSGGRGRGGRGGAVARRRGRGGAAGPSRLGREINDSDSGEEELEDDVPMTDKDSIFEHEFPSRRSQDGSEDEDSVNGHQAETLGELDAATRGSPSSFMSGRPASIVSASEREKATPSRRISGGGNFFASDSLRELGEPALEEASPTRIVEPVVVKAPGIDVGCQTEPEEKAVVLEIGTQTDEIREVGIAVATQTESAAVVDVGTDPESVQMVDVGTAKEEEKPEMREMEVQTDAMEEEVDDFTSTPTKTRTSLLVGRKASLADLDGLRAPPIVGVEDVDDVDDDTTEADNETEFEDAAESVGGRDTPFKAFAVTPSGTMHDLAQSEAEAGDDTEILAVPPIETRDIAIQTDDIEWGNYVKNHTSHPSLPVFAELRSAAQPSSKRDSINTFGGRASPDDLPQAAAVANAYVSGERALSPTKADVDDVSAASRPQSAFSERSVYSDESHDIPPVPPVPTFPVDLTKGKNKEIMGPPPNPSPVKKPGLSPRKSSASAISQKQPPPPPRPTSPPPADLLYRATTPTMDQQPTTGLLTPGTYRSQYSTTGPAAQRKPSQRGLNGVRHQASFSDYPASPSSAGPASLASRKAPRPSGATGHFSDVASMHSRRMSIASSDGGSIVDGVPYLEQGRGPDSTDPAVIHAITQTMIGEFLHKYTRRTIGKGISEKRHRRFFWVHPYTKTLYWSSSDPGVHGTNQSSAKSVFIEGVREVVDTNAFPPGLHQGSIIVKTPNREMKLTAPTRERHDMWYNAINYLLARPDAPDASPNTPTMNSQRSDYSDATTTRSMRTTISRNAGASLSPSGAQRMYGQASTSEPQLVSRGPRTRRSDASSLRPQSRFQPKRAGTAAEEWERQSQFGSPRSLKIYDGGVADESLEVVDPNDIPDDLVGEEEGWEGLENVRACCGGRHDVGSLSRKHHHHHHHHHAVPSSENGESQQQQRIKKPRVSGKLGSAGSSASSLFHPSHKSNR